MSITVTELGTGTATSTDATSNADSAVSPTAGNLVLLFFGNTRASASIDTPSIQDPSGVLGTITAIKTRGFNTGSSPIKRVSAWWGVATGNTGVLTADCGANTQSGWFRYMAQVTGANTSAPIVQSQSAFSDSTATSATCNLSGTSAGNAVFGFMGCAATSTPTVGSGYTSGRGGQFGTPTAGFRVQYILTGQDTVDFSGFTSSVWGALSFEVAADAGLSLAPTGSELTTASGTGSVSSVYSAWNALRIRWS